LRELDPFLADRLVLSIDLGLEAVVAAIARALQRANVDEPRVTGAGASHPDSAAVEPQSATKRTRWGPGSVVGWFKRNRDPLLVALIPTFIAAVAAGFFLGWFGPTSGGASSESGGPEGGTETAIEEKAKEESQNNTPPGIGKKAIAVIEYADNRNGSPVFADPTGTPVKRVPSTLPYGTEVVVTCFAPNESGMTSVSGFYRIASGEWEGDYVVADTMTNGGKLGGTESPNVDERLEERLCDES
jgi:hypothetical protein